MRCKWKLFSHWICPLSVIGLTLSLGRLVLTLPCYLCYPSTIHYWVWLQMNAPYHLSACLIACMPASFLACLIVCFLAFFLFLIKWIFSFPIKHFKISHLILTGRSSTGRCWCWPGCLGCSSTPSLTRPGPPWWWGTTCPRPGAWPGRHVATLFVLKCQHRQLSTPNSLKERSLAESRRPALEF